MSLYGLVRPFPKKAQSADWSWVRAQQLAPGNLTMGPTIDPRFYADFGGVAPYIDNQNPDNIFMGRGWAGAASALRALQSTEGACPVVDAGFRQEVQNELSLANVDNDGRVVSQIPYRVWGYSNTNRQGKLQPIVYLPRERGKPVISYAMAANSYTI